MGKDIISENEVLARFGYKNSGYFRTDKVVKPKAFMPDPYKKLSVNRHKDLSSEQIWKIGKQIGRISNRVLKGRADIRMQDVKKTNLEVEVAPEFDNPYHANIIHWPAQKEERMDLAKQLAASSFCSFYDG